MTADAKAAAAKPPAPTPSDPSRLLFVGTHGNVVAVDKFTGAEAWRAKLSGFALVTLLHEDGVLLAATNGRVFGLDPATGVILWRNELPGLRFGHACLATIAQAANAGADPVPQADAIEETRRRSAAT